MDTDGLPIIGGAPRETWHTRLNHGLCIASLLVLFLVPSRWIGVGLGVGVGLTLAVTERVVYRHPILGENLLSPLVFYGGAGSLAYGLVDVLPVFPGLPVVAWLVGVVSIAVADTTHRLHLGLSRESDLSQSS